MIDPKYLKLETYGMTSSPNFTSEPKSSCLAKIIVHILCLPPTKWKSFVFKSLSPHIKLTINCFPWFFNQDYIIHKKHAIRDKLLYVLNKHIQNYIKQKLEPWYNPTPIEKSLVSSFGVLTLVVISSYMSCITQI